MRITRQRKLQYKLILRNIYSGTPVAFEAPFSQAMSTGDIFLIADVCESYLPKGSDIWNKKPIINVRTGKLSWVDSSRKVRVVDCTVAIAE